MNNAGKPVSHLERFLHDIVAAAACFNALGYLTAPVKGGLAEWFRDVEIDMVFPLPEMPLSDEERSSLTSAIVSEMLAATQRYVDEGIDDAVAFDRLAPILDPLWRELFALSTTEMNAAWRSSLPSSAEEKRERIFALESVTGLAREDIRREASTDRDLLAVVTRFGVTLEDLDSIV